jgi:cell fate regulator YaaT (PSP1 superfamily)
VLVPGSLKKDTEIVNEINETTVEPRIVGVRFRREGKTYYFDDAGLTLNRDDAVVVDTEFGPALGVVATTSGMIPQCGRSAPLKKVLRLATDEDLQVRMDLQRFEQECHKFCKERIAERALPMKLIEAECLFDRSKVIFYFTAENRVDFRDLVKDLVQRFRIRIELRQIGARQETRMIKGLGICGREVCCAGFLSNLDRVTVKMAKEQGMSLNPEKISGLCGRLMCCLAYEYDTYAERKKKLPKCGKVVQTDGGPGKVLRQNVLKGDVLVLLEDGKEMTLRIKDPGTKDPE